MGTPCWSATEHEASSSLSPSTGGQQRRPHPNQPRHRVPHNSPTKAPSSADGGRQQAKGGRIRAGGAGRIQTVGSVYAEHRKMQAMAVHRGIIATAGDSGVVALHFEGCCVTRCSNAARGSNRHTSEDEADNEWDGTSSTSDSNRSTSNSSSNGGGGGSIVSSGSAFHPMASTSEAGRRVRVRLFGHKAPLTSCEFNKTGSLLLTGAEDGSARVWCIRTQSCVSAFWVPFAAVYGVQFGPTVQWKPSRHAAFGPRCKAFVAATLYSAMWAWKSHGLPRLPKELWLCIFEFFDSDDDGWVGNREALPAASFSGNGAAGNARPIDGPSSSAAAAAAARKRSCSSSSSSSLQNFVPEETLAGQVNVVCIQERQMTFQARHG